MAVDSDTFRALMRQFPAGVTIVTFDDDDTPSCNGFRIYILIAEARTVDVND